MAICVFVTSTGTESQPLRSPEVISRNIADYNELGSTVSQPLRSPEVISRLAKPAFYPWVSPEFKSAPATEL